MLLGSRGQPDTTPSQLRARLQARALWAVQSPYEWRKLALCSRLGSSESLDLENACGFFPRAGAQAWQGFRVIVASVWPSRMAFLREGSEWAWTRRATHLT